jgi:hypothetical protein
MRPGRDSQRLLLATLSALTVAAWGFSVAHQVFVRHTVCLEHGELVHVDDDAARAARERHHLEAGAERPDEARLGLAESEPGAHEHCALLAVQRTPWCAPGRLDARLADSVRPPALAPREAEAPRAAVIPLLRLAPKASPTCGLA